MEIVIDDIVSRHKGEIYKQELVDYVKLQTGIQPMTPEEVVEKLYLKYDQGFVSAKDVKVTSTGVQTPPPAVKTAEQIVESLVSEDLIQYINYGEIAVDDELYIKVWPKKFLGDIWRL